MIQDISLKLEYPVGGTSFFDMLYRNLNSEGRLVLPHTVIYLVMYIFTCEFHGNFLRWFNIFHEFENFPSLKLFNSTVWQEVSKAFRNLICLISNKI